MISAIAYLIAAGGRLVRYRRYRRTFHADARGSAPAERSTPTR